LTYILTLKFTPWIKLKNANDHWISQPYLLHIIYQNMEYVKILFLSNNKLKLAYADNIGYVQANQMQSKSSKCHQFTMQNFNARIRVTVCFLDIAEGQINMAKVYFHGVMTV